MRISKSQVNSFIAAVEEIGIYEFEIFLFGSRAIDSAKGGDIDLLIVAHKKEIDTLLSKKPILLAKIKLKSEDERIDITFLDKDGYQKDSFFSSIPKNQLIDLKKLGK